VVLVAPLIWIFGEVVPKSVFQQQADTITPKAVFPLRACSILFSPLLVVFTGLTRAVTRVLGGGEARNPFTLREEIVALVQTSVPGGDIQPAEKGMISHVFRFSETTARDVLVPLIDVVAIERGANCGEAMRLALEQVHKRLPVYEGRVDRITGVLNVLDLLLENEQAPIEPHVEPVPYVPESKRIEDILLDFRRDGCNLAIVVDEYGGVEGLVTLEDVIEEVVGEIEDEYDAGEQKVQWVREIGPGEYLVSGRAELTTVNDKLGLDLPDGNYETLGGFLLEIAGEIPRAGDLLHFRHITFAIEKVTPRLILEVRVRW
jgi:CBS domain containing-hemolysin-like protein